MEKGYKLILTIILLSISLDVSAQLQPKKFYVNACSFFGSFKTDRKAICDGFEISIDAKNINIGDEFDLKIISFRYDPKTKQTTFDVQDPKKEFGGAILGKTQAGNEYLQLNYLRNNEVIDGGLLFQYWDYVSDYDFWRAERNSKKIIN